MTVVLCTIERYPISLYISKRKLMGTNTHNRELKKDLAIVRNSSNLYKNLEYLVEEYRESLALDEIKTKKEMSTSTKVWRVITDFQNVYNIIYLIFSLLALLLHPLF